MKKIQIELSPDQFVTMFYALKKAIIYTEFFDPSHSHYQLTVGDIPEWLEAYKRLYSRLCDIKGWSENPNLCKCNELHAKIIEREE